MGRALIPTDPDAIVGLTGWTLYLCIFALPFVQEDVAVIAAATASLAGAGASGVIFLVILLGLTGSDIWKYWLGWFARHYSWAHKFAEKPGVSVAGKLVRHELYQTLLTARFVPGTRIPTYIACGFFESPYLRFVVYVVSTAMLYVVLMFALFHFAGEVIGERATIYMPFLAVACVAAYIVYRWRRHRRRKVGPLTPMSDEYDAPLPPSDDALVEEEGAPADEGASDARGAAAPDHDQ